MRCRCGTCQTHTHLVGDRVIYKFQKEDRMLFTNEAKKREWMDKQTVERLQESEKKIASLLSRSDEGSSQFNRVTRDLALIRKVISERRRGEWRSIRQMQPAHREYLYDELTYATERQLIGRRDNGLELVESLEANANLATAWPQHHHARIRYGKETVILLIDELERRRLKARLLAIHEKIKCGYDCFVAERNMLSDEEKQVREELTALGTEVSIHGRD